MDREDRKIAKNRRRVRCLLSDGRTIEGAVFVNLFDMNHAGPQRVGELLNGKDAFIPLETPDGVLHLNVDSIVSARMSRLEEGHELMTLGEQYRVQVCVSPGDLIEGDIYANLPQERSRVSDCLNQTQRFCQLFLEEEVVYIGVRFILYVQD